MDVPSFANFPQSHWLALYQLLTHPLYFPSSFLFLMKSFASPDRITIYHSYPYFLGFIPWNNSAFLMIFTIIFKVTQINIWQRFFYSISHCFIGKRISKENLTWYVQLKTQCLQPSHGHLTPNMVPVPPSSSSFHTCLSIFFLYACVLQISAIARTSAIIFAVVTLVSEMVAGR